MKRNDTIEAKFGARVRELRTKTGLSQEKFALEIGMDRTYLASVEAGRRAARLLNADRLRRYAKLGET